MLFGFIVSDRRIDFAFFNIGRSFGDHYCKTYVSGLASFLHAPITIIQTAFHETEVIFPNISQRRFICLVGEL